MTTYYCVSAVRGLAFWVEVQKGGCAFVGDRNIGEVARTRELPIGDSFGYSHIGVTIICLSRTFWGLAF